MGTYRGERGDHVRQQRFFSEAAEVSPRKRNWKQRARSACALMSVQEVVTKSADREGQFRELG